MLGGWLNKKWLIGWLVFIQAFGLLAAGSGTNVTLHLTLRSTWGNRDFVVIEMTIVNRGAEPIYIWKDILDEHMFRFFDDQTRENISRKTIIISDPCFSPSWEPSWNDICVVGSGKEYRHDIICRIETSDWKPDSACQLSFRLYDQPLPREKQIRMIARYNMSSSDIIRKCRESLGVDLYAGELVASNIVIRTDKRGIKDATY